MDTIDTFPTFVPPGYVILPCRDGHQYDFLLRMLREYENRNYEVEVPGIQDSLEDGILAALLTPSLDQQTEAVIDFIYDQKGTVSNAVVNTALGLSDGRSGVLLMTVSKRLKKALTAKEVEPYPTPIHIMIEVTKVPVGNQRVSHYRMTDIGRRVWDAYKKRRG